MDLRFIKMRVCEADLILVDMLGEGGGDAHWPLAARAILDRRKGVGALRLALLSRLEKDLWLRVFDEEGGQEVARFDAAVCAARYLLDSGLIGSETLRIRTGLGELVIDILDGSSLGLSLGSPLSLPEGRTLTAELAETRRTLIEAAGESYETLPVALPPFSSRDNSPEGRDTPRGPRAVAVFCAGGTKALRATIGASVGGGRPPPALPVRVISMNELRIGGSGDPRLDALSQAGLAFAAASLVGHVEGEALVRSGSGALWAQLSRNSAIYVAGRPDYVFRGEFTVDIPARD